MRGTGGAGLLFGIYSVMKRRLSALSRGISSGGPLTNLSNAI